MKVGSLIKCVREQHQFFGVIIGVTPTEYTSEGQCTWVHIHWADGHQTWEEWEPSVEDGCFEVINESR